jgi:hypothetical protein
MIVVVAVTLIIGCNNATGGDPKEYEGIRAEFAAITQVEWTDYDKLLIGTYGDLINYCKAKDTSAVEFTGNEYDATVIQALSDASTFTYDLALPFTVTAKGRLFSGDIVEIIVIRQTN